MKKLLISAALSLALLGRAIAQNQTQPNSSVTVRVSGQPPISYGTVTSVGITSSLFNWAPGTITTNGTFTGTLANQSEKTILMGLTAGSGSGGPAFRLLRPDDLAACSGGQFITWSSASAFGCSAGGASGYATVQDEGGALTARTTINFIGAGVTCVDNSGSTRTDCTVTGGGTNALLDGTAHTDTLAGSVARGDVIVGNSTPKWARLAKGAAGTALTSDGTDVTFTKPTLYDYTLKAQDAQFLSANFPTLTKAGTNFPLMSLSYSNQPATSQDAFWEFEVPKYDTGNLTLRILWYSAGTTNNVIWRATIAAVTPDSDAAVTSKAFATDQAVTTAASGTANRLVSSVITISNLDSLAVGDKVWIKITRDRTDTTTSAAFFVSARLSYGGIY